MDLPKFVNPVVQRLLDVAAVVAVVVAAAVAFVPSIPIKPNPISVSLSVDLGDESSDPDFVV